MIKEEDQKNSNRAIGMNNQYRNIYVDRESELESELERMFIDIGKAFKNLKIMKDEIVYKNFTLNSVKNCCLYSAINKEFYFLIPVEEKNPIDKGIKINYFLFTFSQDKNLLKSSKKLNFILESNNSQINNFVVEDFILNKSNENQMCFFNKDYIAIISNLKEQTLSEGDILINIIHTSQLSDKEKETTISIKPSFGNFLPNSLNKNKQIFNKNISSDHFYKKFKFSNFDNYFGVLFNNNSFRLYSIDSRVSKCLVTNIAKDLEIVDFSFGPNLDFSWLNFSVIFLDLNGGIHYICPIFPDEFKLQNSYVNNMKNFVKNLQIFDTNKEKNQEEVLNSNLLLHLEKSLLNDPNKENIKIDDYLHNFNKKIIVNNIVTIDKRRNTNMIILTNESQKIKYKQIFILKTYPLTILRISDKNFIDVILCLDHISPLRKTSVLFAKEAYLLETIYFKNVSQFSEKFNTNNLNFLNLRIMENYYTTNKKNEMMSEKNKFSLYVNFLNDLYEIKLNYLKNIGDSYNFFSGRDDLKFDFYSKVNKILVFNYEMGKSYGYFMAEKFDDSLILINDQLKVKEFSFDLFEEENKIYNKNFDLSILENNVKKLNFSMNLNIGEISEINFERMEELAKKTLKNSAEAESVLIQKIKQNPILNKEIKIDENNFKKVALENLDDFIKVQIDGIFNIYDDIFNQRSSNIKEKTKIYNSIIENLNVSNFPKLKSEIEKDKKKIDDLRKNVIDKKKIIQTKSQNLSAKLNDLHFNNKFVLEKYHSLKGYFDNTKNNYIELKKSIEEVKEEFTHVLNELKGFKIIKEKLDPNLIDRELLRKQKIFEQNLKQLSSNLLNSSNKLENYFNLK